MSEIVPAAGAIVAPASTLSSSADSNGLRLVKPSVLRKRMWRGSKRRVSASASVASINASNAQERMLRVALSSSGSAESGTKVSSASSERAASAPATTGRAIAQEISAKRARAPLPGEGMARTPALEIRTMSFTPTTRAAALRAALASPPSASRASGAALGTIRLGSPASAGPKGRPMQSAPRTTRKTTEATTTSNACAASGRTKPSRGE